MSIFKRLMFLLTAGPEIDAIIKEEKRKALIKAHEDNAHRLNLCYKHRQEQNHSHFSSHNCDYCKLEKGKTS